MANILTIRRSATQNAVPSPTQINSGEMAMNTYDGKLYLKKTVGGVDTVLALVATNPLGVNSLMWTIDSSLMWSS